MTARGQSCFSPELDPTRALPRPTGPSSMKPPRALPAVIAVCFTSIPRDGWARVPASLKGLVSSPRLRLSFPVIPVPTPSFGMGFMLKSSPSVRRLIVPSPTTLMVSLFNTKAVVSAIPLLILNPHTMQLTAVEGDSFLKGLTMREDTRGDIRSEKSQILVVDFSLAHDHVGHAVEARHEPRDRSAAAGHIDAGIQAAFKHFGLFELPEHGAHVELLHRHYRGHLGRFALGFQIETDLEPSPADECGQGCHRKAAVHERHLCVEVMKGNLRCEDFRSPETHRGINQLERTQGKGRVREDPAG